MAKLETIKRDLITLENRLINSQRHEFDNETEKQRRYERNKKAYRFMLEMLNELIAEEN